LITLRSSISVDRLHKYADDIIEQTKDGETGEHPLMCFVDYDYNSKTKEKTYNKVEHQSVYDTLVELMKSSHQILKKGHQDPDDLSLRR